MNDVFDTLITESLHHAAATVPHRGAGFSDVRRRVRRRRQRNVAAISLPAVFGVAAIGALHSAPRGSGLRAGTTDQTAPGTATTSPPATTQPTPTTISHSFLSGTTTSIPNNLIGEVVCLNATTGDDSNSAVRACQLRVGGGVWLTAGTTATHSFVMALKPNAATEAAKIAATLGLDLRPLDTSYLPTPIDLSTTAAKVAVVIGSDLVTVYSIVPTTPQASTTNVAP
jgi:hypothetical protein